MTRFLMTVTAIILALASTANTAYKKGDTVVEILGGWATEEGVEPGDVDSFVDEGATGGDLDGWLVSGGISWFTSDNFQIGIAGLYTNLEADNVTGAVDASVAGIVVPGAFSYEVDTEATLYGVGGRARWHFNPKGKWTPYVGLQGLWVTGDIDISGVSTAVIDPGTISQSVDTDGILWGPMLGVGIELTPSNRLLLEYQYHMWEGDIGDALDPGHAFSVGFAHTLK